MACIIFVTVQAVSKAHVRNSSRVSKMQRQDVVKPEGLNADKCAEQNQHPTYFMTCLIH